MIEPTKRQAVILAADVAGYTRLMGEDEIGTLVALGQFRRGVFQPAVADHDGSVVKNMGDGWLVEFNSAGDAVNCALQIQNNLVDNDLIRLRIGVHVGDVFHQDEDIFGESVNIAARLQEISHPGGIALSAASQKLLDHNIAKDFTDTGVKKLKNINEVIRVYQSGGGAGDISTIDLDQMANLALPSKPSIAVLPFDNMSRDPDQEYFSDGLTEDIITSLSYMRSLFVIARNSSFAFKGQSVNIRDIGDKLGVRYVLEGSVRTAGTRVRVNAQLIEARTAGHIWARRYDRQMEDIFDLQDEITRDIAASVEGQLEVTERAEAAQKPTQSMDAWNCLQRGKWHHYLRTEDHTAKGRQWFEMAIEKDPEFAAAYAGLASCAIQEVFNSYTKDVPGTVRDGFIAGQKAMELDPRDSYVQSSFGGVCIIAGEHSKAIAASRTALNLNPNDARAQSMLALALFLGGNAKEAIPNFQESIRLNPQDRRQTLNFMTLGCCHHVLGELDDAIVNVDLAIEGEDVGIWPHLMRASILADREDHDEATATIAHALTYFPDLTCKIVPTMAPNTHPPYMEVLVDGLRKAGLSEG